LTDVYLFADICKYRLLKSMCEPQVITCFGIKRIESKI